jgi:hypothetical protein
MSATSLRMATPRPSHGEPTRWGEPGEENGGRNRDGTGGNRGSPNVACCEVAIRRLWGGTTVGGWVEENGRSKAEKYWRAGQKRYGPVDGTSQPTISSARHTPRGSWIRQVFPPPIAPEP